ncbi:MAG: hypothetical protein H8E44_27380 [Planctomycetes bacterium]|nr:hypothetical protein [Planctomycetota bacterium]MBL7044367.1 hypothetical protein [Pirellulaceae bacterium]
MLAKLAVLDLLDTYVTDDGLKHLTGLTNLSHLSLSGTPVTDDGLRHLTGLTSLRSLDVCDTQVTDEGVMELLEALPDCSIEWGARFDIQWD